MKYVSKRWNLSEKSIKFPKLNLKILFTEFKTFLKNEPMVFMKLSNIQTTKVEKLAGLDAKAAYSPSIAIHVHLFHKNYYRRLKRVAKNFPEALILVSVPNANLERYLSKKFHKLMNSQEIFICVTKNQGRNFGPLINEFSDQVLTKEILIHVHSKDAKGSFYRWMWSYHLWRELVLRRSCIERNMAVMLGSECGIIMPFSLRWMPNYFSWLGNFEFASVLFPEISECSSPGAEFFYPIGGMFMSRVEAISPILHSEVLKKSFIPEELNQVGIREGITPEHMVERALGLIPITLGFAPYTLLTENKQFYNSANQLKAISKPRASK
jgi:lipopolysaccharide biosynthesis protein